MRVRDHEQLRVWHTAMQMAESVYAATQDMPRREIFGLAAQLRRSAVSVPSNIAEGCGRRTKREFAHYLAVAAGSLQELHTQALIAIRTGLIHEDPTLMRAIGETKAQLIRLRVLVESDLD